MVFREDEHLGLASQTTKRGCMQNAITVTFEAGAVRIRRFLESAIARTE
jgi:hypothetical protein